MDKNYIDTNCLEIYEPDELFENQILSMREAASFFKVSMRTMHKRLHSDGIPHFKVGRQIRFHLPQLVEWLQGN
jgi:excisionase family DNA binding protein